ncbi:bicaudal C homolog 2 isoform X4 [Danio rerio]|uniref:Bicaudal C homolog 2 isoform X4 n=1 Tax=Danio rerio TaxID=7955 RepID=A0AC58H602_DANRE
MMLLTLAAIFSYTFLKFLLVYRWNYICPVTQHKLADLEHREKLTTMTVFDSDQERFRKAGWGCFRTPLFLVSLVTPPDTDTHSLAMAASETSSTVPESPEPEPCDTTQAELNQDEEDEEDEASEAQQQEPSDPDSVEERFRIDRKKLEIMLYAPTEASGLSGEEFFEKVMRETNTQVKWPSKLKIGAKSKKDPHVKVEGKRANVLEAKRKILELLETKVNKVTLKMDVTHTEHSHVIGKGGGNIKKVMEETSCHIHFPDSNRSNSSGEKSNQVSIAGPVEGVESARKQIRDLQPLVLTFDLPVTLAGGVVADTSSPVIQHVAQAFGVTVSFRTQPKLYCSTCSVRGVTANTAALKKAICVLMELLLGSGVNGVMVSTQLDVTSQQHLFLLGQNGANFLTVMHQTHTQIILPDLSSPQHTPSLLIQGTADGVCLARQQLMDCLPVCLMFDLKDEGESDPRRFTQMMQNLGVFISVKPKVKQTAKSVVVKGLERNIVNVYEARRLLLGLDSTEVSVSTKSVCEVSVMSKHSVDPLLANNGITGYWLNVLMQQLRLTDTGSVSIPDAVIGSLSGKPRPTPPPPPGLAVSSEDGRIGLKGVESKLEKILENEDQQTQAESETCSMSHSEVTDVREVIVKPTPSSRRGSQSESSREFNQPITSERLVRADVESVYLNRDRRCSLRIFPSMDINNEDHEYERKKLLANQAMQQKPVVTEVRTPTDTWSGLGFSKSMPTDAVKELRAVSRRCYRPYNNSNNNNNNNHHSQQQQQSWSGKEHGWTGSDSENWRERRGSASSSPPPSSSSYSLSASRSSDVFLTEGGATVSRHLIGRSPSPAHADDLIELLAQLGLEKYIDIFQQQEIDYQTFLTLSDEDLKEVGVSTFGARRKMLLAIADLSKKRKIPEAFVVKSGYLEGGASGRLPRIMDEDVAAKSNRW